MLATAADARHGNVRAGSDRRGPDYGLSTVWPCPPERASQAAAGSRTDAVSAAPRPDAATCATMRGTTSAWSGSCDRTPEDEAGTRVDQHLLTIDTLSHLQAGTSKSFARWWRRPAGMATRAASIEPWLQGNRARPALARLIEDQLAGLIYDTTMAPTTCPLAGRKFRSPTGRTCIATSARSTTHCLKAESVSVLGGTVRA